MAKQATRDRFSFDAHPWCCFCGGVVPATTRDHVPPQSMFLARHTPEGFLFPACEACNQGTSKFDRLFALASFLVIPEPTVEEVRARDKLKVEIAKDHPGIFGASMEVGCGDQARRVNGLQLPMEMVEAIDVVAAKLARALHYYFARRIIPRDWKRYVRIAHWPSHLKVRIADPEFEWLFKDQANLRRSKLDLSDQFSCRYTADEDGARGAYLCAIRGGLQIAILVRL